MPPLLSGIGCLWASVASRLRFTPAARSLACSPLPPAPPSFAATQNLMQTAVLISSMSKPLTLIIIILLTIGFIVAVVGVSGGFLLNS